MSYDRFLSRVTELSGAPSREAAEELASTALVYVAAFLDAEDLARVANGVDPVLACRLAPPPELELDRSVEALYRRVAAATGQPLGHAAELTQVVCEALSAELSPTVLAHLRHLEDQGWRELFVVRSRQGVPAEEVETARPQRTTLAEGRPGSRHPLSEAHPDRAHAESVARADNPHEATKLSSARGLTQERRDHDLASGKPPGPDRPLSSG